MNAPICGHENFDVSPRVEPVQLVDQLQHGSLHLIVPTSAVVKSCTTDGVHLVEKYNASLFTARHLEELSDHPCALTDIFLDEL
jgi:hypothetical protein